MAKNDYFVIMYRILAYLYACMKQGEKPDMSTVSFEALGIPESYYNYVMINMIEKQYIKADVLVVPSIWDEPFGRVVIEGNSYGLPVICSNKGGIPEIINEMCSGSSRDT